MGYSPGYLQYRRFASPHVLAKIEVGLDEKKIQNKTEGNKRNQAKKEKQKQKQTNKKSDKQHKEQ